jgi:hypothetical protein
VVGDFDGDGRDEIAVAPDAPLSEGNDFWVLDFLPGEGWGHLGRFDGFWADFDCTDVVPSDYPAKFAVVGDFDGDKRDEVAIAPDAPGSEGNDFWVMKYVGDPGAGTWKHMGQTAAGFWADFDCSDTASPADPAFNAPAKFAVVGDFDGDGRDEIAIAPDLPGTQGNDFWVMKYVGQFPTGQWQHASPTGYPSGADLDCSPADYAAKFAVVGDLDGGGCDEIVVAPDAPDTEGNDFWVMRWDGPPFLSTG